MIINQEIDHDLLLYIQEDTSEKKFWINTLKDITYKTFIPNDLHKYDCRITTQCYEKNIAPQISDLLLKLGKGNLYTLQLILNASLGVLLKKYIQEETIVINNPIYTQKTDDAFINTFIPVIIRPDDNSSFIDIVKAGKNYLIEAIKNQNFPIQLLLKNEKGLPSNKEWVTDVSLSIGNIHQTDYLKNVKSNILFEFAVDNQIQCKIHYNFGLYSNTHIIAIFDHFEYILSQISQNQDIIIADIQLLNETEKGKLIYKRNNTERKNNYKLVHQVFYEKAKSMAKQTAIESKYTRYTYEEINEKTNKLARLLHSRGIGRNSLVPVIADPSPEMIIGILGILKSGGAYIPISPEYPEERIAFIIKDSCAQCLLTTSDYLNKYHNHLDIIDINDPGVNSFDNSDLELINEIDDVVYSIYTSGSTGRPKGVLVEHGSVFNILNALEELYPLGRDDAFLLKTNYTFDVSVTEIFGWFFGTGRLVILDKGNEKDPRKIAEYIDKYQITHLNYVPSILNVFLDIIDDSDRQKLKPLKYLFVAGEAFQPELAKKMQKLDWIQVENIYGPTEGTIYTTYYSLPRHTDIVPIGKPLTNVSVYSLNRNKELQPENLPGELCIGGNGVARGYLNRPELTSEKFFENPFTGNGRIYRTGDLMRWAEDGNVEYLGRIDHQVKIRGYRIELEEIEKKILKNEEIENCIVVKKTNKDGHDYLCAYYMSATIQNTIDLRHFVLSSLPDYMCPEFFVKIEKIPYTLSGKIDLQSLPDPVLNPKENKDYLAPATLLQKQIATVWETILGVENVGVTDNFFLLGGNSTKAILLSNELEKVLGREIPVVDLFEYVTINSFINYLSKTGTNQSTLPDNPERLVSAKENKAKQRNKRLQK